MLARMHRKGNALTLLARMPQVQPLWKTVWRLLKKLKLELLYDLAIALLGIYPKDIIILMQRNTCTLIFIIALSIIAKLWKKPKCPSTDDWIKKI